MKNIVSFETAKALKDAGFPQPEPEWGQFWYNRHEMCCFCEKKSMEPEGMVFAPTATDILEQLGEYFSIGSWNGKFVINQHPELLPEPIGAPARYHGTHDNPAEAAAAAWLALKKVLEV